MQSIIIIISILSVVFENFESKKGVEVHTHTYTKEEEEEEDDDDDDQKKTRKENPKP